MGHFSVTHWLIVALVVLVLFGGGKISRTMGDFGKGIRSFRKGLAEEDEEEGAAKGRTALAPPPQLVQGSPTTAEASSDTKATREFGEA